MHRPKKQEPTDPLIEQIAEVPFYIPATGPSTRPRRNLKHDDCFAIFDSHGDIGATPGGADGLYCRDTRFLGLLELQLNGTQLLLLGSNVRDDNALLTVDLTNPDIYFEQKLVLPKDTLHIIRTIFLWNNTCLSAAAGPEPRRPPGEQRPWTVLFERFRRSVRGQRHAARTARQCHHRNRRVRSGAC